MKLKDIIRSNPELATKIDRLALSLLMGEGHITDFSVTNSFYGTEYEMNIQNPEGELRINIQMGGQQ